VAFAERRDEPALAKGTQGKADRETPAAPKLPFWWWWNNNVAS